MRPRLPLPALLLLAAGLNLWGLELNGYANEYYSAAVRSMSTSWHAFLYGSFDASGVMTVDKPPLALWIQVASVKVFGFHPLAMLIPQALMGVAAVGLTYDLVRRRFGAAGGLAAGLILALTPITVAISRHNNPDALLVLCSVAALWALVRALEDGRIRWLVLAGACVGLGFEAKMAAALLVVPGIAAAWLWVRPRGWPTAFGGLAAGGGALLATAGAWPLLVALTPGGSRPWVSGTADDSVLSLILGYNGLGRLAGQAGGPQGTGGGGPGGGVFGGDPGLFRLLGESLGGQAGWLLGFALAGGIAVLAGCRARRADPRTGWLIAVGGAFAVTAAAFSLASGIFHPYYVSLLAPFTASLAGAGFAELRGSGRTAKLLAAPALTLGLLAQLAVLDALPDQFRTAAPWIAAAVALAAFAAAASGERVRRAALTAGLAALLIAPATWSVQTLGHATSGTFPAGGPATASFGGGMFGGTNGVGTAVAYAAANGGGTVAVASQSSAAQAILAGETDVVALGGFSGRESEVSVDWLAAAVRDGEIRYVLTKDASGPGMMDDGRTGAATAMAAAASACTAVGDGLYDCGGQADALAALTSQSQST
ncbi:MAG: glycosyltransferase family 39 protein [Solirubrobacteraceae bacterium]